jgi:hypothetical protein
LPSDTNTQNSYAISCVDGDNSDEEKIRLTQSGAAGLATDDVVLEAGTGLSIARDGDKITFTNTVTNTDTQLTTEQVQDIAGALVATGGTKTGITVTYDDSSNNMDFVVASDLNTSGNAGTATALATARAINGVNFDGTAAITVPAAGSTLTDTVPVSKGGTNATSFTDKAVIITQDSGTDTLAAAAMTTNGSLLIGGSSGPAVATLTAGSNITITNSDGGITIAAAGTGGGGDGDIEGVTAGTGLSGGGSTGSVTLNVEAAQTGITSVVNSSLEIGRDADNRIKFGTDNQIIFRVSGGDGITMKASGEIEATKFDGALEGNADTATALATARNIGGVSFDGTGDINLPGVNTAGNQNTSGTAAVATTVTVADESSDTSCNVLFTTAATGDLAPKSGTNLTFNSSSGVLTATGFAGDLTGDVTGNVSGTAATVTGAAQSNITSLGTLTTLSVDNITINGNAITSTNSNGDITLTPNGTGNVTLGNFTFNADQSVGSGQDNYVLTYDHSSTSIGLEAATGSSGGGLGGADQTLSADRTIDTNGYNLDIELDSSGTADTFTIHDGTHDLFQVDTTTSGTIFSVNDVSGLPKLSVNSNGMLKQAGNYPLNISVITCTAGSISSADKRYLPVGVVENINSDITAAGDWESHYVAPFNGKFLRIAMQFSHFGTGPGSTVLGFHKARNGTAVASLTATPSGSGNFHTQIFDFENESTDFDAGDILSWSIDPTNSVYYVAATIVLALDPSNNY